MIVDLREAEGLSGLVARVEAGEELVISRDGQPVAKLVATMPAAPGESIRDRRVWGQDAGKILWIAPDFNDYIPEGFEDDVCNWPGSTGTR